jgi:peptide/nickel transport system permease protein
LRTYLIKRALSMIPVLVGVLILVFLSLRLAPGDPVSLLVPPDLTGAAAEAAAAKLRAELGLDQPLAIQFARYVSKVLQGDFGRSLRGNVPIAKELFERIPATMQLGLAALLIGLAMGVPLGVLSAQKRGSVWDNLVMLIALVGVSFPNFWLGSLLILLFGLVLEWLPPSGYGGPFYTLAGIKSLILPAFTLAVGTAAVLARLTRSTMLEIMREDYIRTARAKGLSDRVVVYKHALRNAMVPIVTVLGVQMGYLLGGAVVIENVFSWPGVGRYLVGGINGRDYPVVQSTVLVLSTAFVLAMFVTDIFYALVDPRIRYD